MTDYWPSPSVCGGSAGSNISPRSVISRPSSVVSPPQSLVPSPLSVRLSQLHASVHRLEPKPPTALADRRPHATRVDASLERDREVGRQTPVDRAHVEVGV